MGTSTARFNRVDKQFVELRQQIAAEGEKTRRHFDISVEQMKAERNLALDIAAVRSARRWRFDRTIVLECG
jgi:hypothetical protein